MTKDLATRSEIAQIAGVQASAVSNWIKRNVGFPKPVITSISGKCMLWDIHEVQKWLKKERKEPSQIDRAWMKEYL